jgi:hypothetical protein
VSHSNVFRRFRHRLGVRSLDYADEDEALRRLDDSLATLDRAAGRDEPLRSRDPLGYARLAANAARPFRRRNVAPLVWSTLAGWAALGVLIGANFLAFRALDENYFGWYLENGAVIAVALAFVSVLMELDRVPNLVSAHPLGYVGAWAQVLSQVMTAWIPVFEPPFPQSTRVRSFVLDTLFSWVVFVLYAAALAGYALVVAPLQYWLNLVVGAPARSAVGSSVKAVVDRESTGNATLTLVPAVETKDEGATGVVREEIGFGRRPVAATAAISAGILLILSRTI